MDYKNYLIVGLVIIILILGFFALGGSKLFSGTEEDEDQTEGDSSDASNGGNSGESSEGDSETGGTDNGDSGDTETGGTEGEGTTDGGTGDTNTEEEKLEIPKGAVALFYTSGLGSNSDSLDVYDSDGTVYTVEIDSSSRAMFMYLPDLAVVKAMKTYTSTSYSQNMVYPYVTDERFFVVRDWGSDWDIDNTQWTIEEFNMDTGNLISTSQFSAAGFAVVNNKIYYTANKKLYSFDVGGSGYYAEELQYTYPGKLYAVGDNLVSVLVDTTDPYNPTFSIRTHNLNTGAVAKTWYEDIMYVVSTDTLFPGETSMYQVVAEGSMRYIYRYPINGQPSELFEFSLESGQTDVYVAEDDGYLAILIESSTSKGKMITDLVLYNLNTNAEENLELEPFTAPTSFDRLGAAFLLVD